MTDLNCFPRQPSRQLTLKQEYRIWTLAMCGIKIETLASLFHVTRFTVRQIAKRKKLDAKEIKRFLSTQLARDC